MELGWTHCVEVRHNTYGDKDSGQQAYSSAFSAHLLQSLRQTFLPWLSTFWTKNILKHVINFEKMNILVKTSKGMDPMLEVKYILAYFAGSGMKC